MPAPTPFAYGPLGEYLVASDGRWVCVGPDGDEGPEWSFQATAPVVGVRMRGGILVVDQSGVLTRHARADGKLLGKVDCEIDALALDATPAGMWMVSHPEGVCIGKDNAVQRRSTFPGLTCEPERVGDRMAVGTESGEVLALDLSNNEKSRLRLRIRRSPGWATAGWGGGSSAPRIGSSGPRTTCRSRMSCP